MACYDWLLSQIGQPGDGWTKEKPKDDGEKVIMTATLIKGIWDYSAFWLQFVGDYYALCDIDGEEWGPYEDLAADLYYVIPSPPKQ